jgi:1,4-alpha-glucan branching enzyme
MRLRFKGLLALFLFLGTIPIQAQVTTIPAVPTLDQPVTIIFNASQGNRGLENYTGKVYIHTGVITNLSSGPSAWRCVVTNWGQDIDSVNLMTRDPQNPNIYRLTINDIRAYYNRGTNCLGNEKILKLAMVFRNEGPSPNREGKGTGNTDLFVDVAQEADLVRFTAPSSSALYPAFAKVGEPTQVRAVAQTTSGVTSISLSINGQQVSTISNDTLNYTLTPEGPGALELVATATFTNQAVKRDTIRIVVNPERANVPVPAGMHDGINYNESKPSEITLVLYAPRKDFVYVIGDMNDWQVDPGYIMNRHEITPDSVRFWITLDMFESGLEYGFQYLVDGSVRVADPYSEKILDPFDDRFIPTTVYPNLKAYPAGKTEFAVGVLQPGKSEYQWEVTNFVPPPKEKLVIYELLLRDFVGTRSYETLIDTLDYLQRLGINAIELMPVNEFEGNLSWGYNPSFHVALDKFYGTEHALKRFIDEAHKRGIAVILDIVLNHAFGQSPLVRMYASGPYGPVTPDNPWFNVTARHDFNVGNDFNHESTATRYFTRRVIEYWMKEYKIDGYRFDLSKGFTQRNTLGNVGAWGQVDVNRINLWKELSDFMWDINPNFYVILEHFADNAEERQLADYGMMLWGNLNHSFSEATMGFNSNSNFNSLSYKNRVWQHPHLIGYMESHDEERMMYRNLTFGSTFGTPSVRIPAVALERTKAAAAFLLTTPGPKMIWQFGELGYAQSINRCLNGSISDACRLTEKPLPWNNIYLNADNQRLFSVFAEMIRLKKTEPAFSTTNFTMDTGGAVKRIILQHEDMDVVLVGNFSVAESNAPVNFTKTGTWYDHFRGTSITINTVANTFPMLPGEFRLYTSKQIAGDRRGMISTDLDEEISTLPTELRLMPNYPNPFNPSTVLSFELPARSNITLEIYDILGRKVASLLSNHTLPAGRHEHIFDARNLASGTYLVRLTTSDIVRNQKIMLIK